MSVDVFGHSLGRKRSARGPPGIGFKLTDDGQYDLDNKRLCNAAHAISDTDVVTLNTIQIIKSEIDTIDKNIKLEVKKFEKINTTIEAVEKRIEKIVSSIQVIEEQTAKIDSSFTKLKNQVTDIEYKIETNRGKIEGIGLLAVQAAANNETATITINPENLPPRIGILSSITGI